MTDDQKAYLDGLNDRSSPLVSDRTTEAGRRLSNEEYWAVIAIFSGAVGPDSPSGKTAGVGES